jgi:autotransporter-associated beta strand protein
MKKTFLAACATLCAFLSPLPIRAADYIWDQSGNDGNWNDPGNWGISGNQNYDVEPTASDGAIFLKNFSATGPVRLTDDGFAQYIRQDSSRIQRTITIDGGQTVDRTLTLSGTAPALFDGYETWVDVTLDGTPNGNGARLKLQINGSGTSIGTRVNKATTLRISCDVSGAGGFTLNGGLDGAGRLMLSGADTYTGPTIASSGVLLVNGSTAVTVNSGGILAGTGLIGGPVTVNPGGLVSPGVNSQAPLIGTLTVSNDFTLAGDLQIEVNKSFAQSNDMISVSGALNNTGAGFIQVLNYGAVLEAGDNFKIFNKPVINGQVVKVLSAGDEVWTNKLAVDGSIEVLSASNTPITGNPTTVRTWNGTVSTSPPWKVPMQTAANWVGNQAPAPNSSNVFVFAGDILVPYQWPYIDTNYGTTILIFSNNIALNSIKILAGSNHVMNLGSYVRQDTAQPCYFGITGTNTPINVNGTKYISTNAFFTNALGDASCGSQTEFQCTGGRLDVYGVLKDGAGTSSRLVKSGPYTLNLTGDLALGKDPNSYTGGTIVNAGPIKMQKLPGNNCIPGDVTVNGTGALQINIGGGEQIADSAVVTLNHSGKLDLANQPETVGTIQGPSASASVVVGSGTLTVAPSAGGAYNGGPGISDFAGSVSGSGTVVKNGTGAFGMLGVNSVGTLIVNAGTLKVNGNSGTGAVTVNTGATLLGQGTIAGAVTVASGGTMGAGFSAGKATLSAGLNMSASGNGATNVWELAAPKDGDTGVAGTDFDQIVLTGGPLALGTLATLDIQFTDSATAPNVSEPFWQSPHTWRFILLSGGLNPGSSNFGRIKNGTYAAGKFTTTADASGILLTFTPSVAPPRITAVTGAGTGSVTVYYTNTLPGTNYVLSYNTNLHSPNWFTAGSKTAAGTGDSQTDNSATSGERYYRVQYFQP